MRLIPSDPDIATLIRRIKDGDIDLQPDFQRGEVWSDAKKERLIDSVLRDWHVPPLHVIEHPTTGRQEVLDGQQRLVALRDFVDGKIRVDGSAQPEDPAIEALDGCTYEGLPAERRRRFDQFTVRVFRLTDYEPGEPFELFYRLNQPTNLTSAEQRNAFFGAAREQVKQLVARLEKVGVTKDAIGFSNSRMAYDDVIARLCLSIERGTIREKVTAGTLTDRYRAGDPFPGLVITHCTGAIECLGAALQWAQRPHKLNKATLYSWLWFFVEAAGDEEVAIPPHLMGDYFDFFEAARAQNSEELIVVGSSSDSVQEILVRQFPMLQSVYDDRATARVADVSSVLARDAVLWAGLLAFAAALPDRPVQHPRMKLLVELVKRANDFRQMGPVSLVEVVTSEPTWGRLK